ncbi:MAG TPA: 4'-phosphopantetheinyl transferase, partial [Corynebacterium sp.]|nr:4'-phosphopantetheinyl transferase [Corynebacterium sp.]
MQGQGLTPESAAYCYLFTDPATVELERFHALHPLEKTLVSNAVDRRKAAFGDARWCAHQALAHLGAGEEPARRPILRGERGMPLWPEGYTGSLTHTDG